jgi:hypothetical protein
VIEVTAFDLVKQALFLVIVVVAYLIFGWQGVTLVIAVGMGFIFDRYVVAIAFTMGFLLHTGGVLYNYAFFTDSTEFVLQKAAIIMGGWPVYWFPVLTVLLPSSLYALAAFFSIYLANFIRTYKP